MHASILVEVYRHFDVDALPAEVQDVRLRRHLRKRRCSLSTDEIDRVPLVCRKGDVLEVCGCDKTIELP